MTFYIIAGIGLTAITLITALVCLVLSPQVQS